MKLEELINQINDSIKNRFELEEKNDFYAMLLSLDSDIEEKDVLRIKRSKNSLLKTWRTLLIVQLEDENMLKTALQWTALVKDCLLNPETADLYLFVISNNNVFSIEHSMKIEATEQFCRKYVQRLDESSKDLVARTFLQSIIEKENNTSIKNDPINTALSETNNTYPWFNKTEQDKWKEVFLSDFTGIDLLDRIIEENNHDTP